MAQPSPSINLIKKKKKDFFDRFIAWALTIGRFIVILTEVIALSTFLSRFSLDRKLVDLHDSIKQKQAIVNLLKNNEDKYRNLQNRLAVSSKFLDSANETTKIFTDLIDFAPSDFIFNNIRLSEQSIQIDASVQSVNSLTIFIKKLQEYPKFSSVSLDRIENKTSSATIAVSITTHLQ
ncbi:MAG: PilN domain-containing protein [bacterium]|nr:PilN domain-containing protein [bacterium]